jgi:tRNA nucleotidyltransferase/poly(A) polymerase
VDAAQIEISFSRPLVEGSRHTLRIGDLLRFLLDSGIRVFVAGGAPRDWLLGEAAGDLDCSLDCDVGQLVELLRQAFPDLYPDLRSNPRFGVVRWAGQGGGGLDLNILRSYRDLIGKSIWTASFRARGDLREDARLRDFSIHAFYYDVRERKLLDPLGCGLDDLQQRVLRLILHPRLWAADPRTSFRIFQFMGRGYTPAAETVDYLEDWCERDVRAMAERLPLWITRHFAADRQGREELHRQACSWCRSRESRAILDRALARVEAGPADPEP